MNSYPINTPITMVNTNGGTDEIDFNADGPTTNLENKILNFVTTTAGDTLYRATGVNNYLERLAIGTSGQILTVNSGIPSWQTATGSQNVFTAFVTSSIAGVPTSRTGGANPGTWFNLNNTYVTWSTASPGTDTDVVFTPATGLYTVPTTGVYQLSALITFDSGIGVNAGAGLPAAPLPRGTAVRQVQIFNVTSATVLATGTVQVSASNTNCTFVSIATEQVSLTAADTVVVRVRHDRTAANTVTIGDVAIVLPSQNYFSGRRVK